MSPPQIQPPRPSPLYRDPLFPSLVAGFFITSVFFFPDSPCENPKGISSRTLWLWLSIVSHLTILVYSCARKCLIAQVFTSPQYLARNSSWDITRTTVPSWFLRDMCLKHLGPILIDSTASPVLCNHARNWLHNYELRVGHNRSAEDGGVKCEFTALRRIESN
ncbi:hypothetical protein M422DRAFT_54778 [Sphaerobolus stellatus SS14]|uniref:Uncharacterized protein n=1 Tax=Sphaerobolus stellatus (strain SS14) TaxID=990650 RepID=A0A0C9TFB9_SPHS4|nr:hypothetical protein M422DRAFT_54778 [Sphaerobolus stellatus SS14]